MQEQVAQDPIQLVEEPEGTKLIARYGAGRIAVFLPRLTEPAANDVGGYAKALIHFELVVSCQCGRADCWAPTSADLRQQFKQCITANFRGPQLSDGNDLHDAFVGLMKSILTIFAQRGMN